MIAGMQWGWVRADKAFAAFGNPNQWAIATSLDAVARETTQNSIDAINATEGRYGDGALDFTLIRLAGGARADFEDAVGWSDLRGHLDSMADAAGKANAAGQLAGNLLAYDESEELLLLRIDDYGASGLGGPEYPDDDTDPADYGNFIKLIRTDLFSDKAEASGGSYGLGKAVYWRYSRFQTAFFASRPAGDESDVLRFIGVCQGFNHQWQGHRFEGRGYLGRRAAGDSSTPSHRADPAALEPIGIARRDRRPGTSALIVGFYDPENPEHDMGKLLDDLRHGIESNFWPMLARERLDIGLWKIDGGDPIRVPLEVETSYSELVAALRAYDSGRRDDELRAAGDVLVRPITIKVPARKTPPLHASFEHEAHLVVTMSDTADDARDDLENKVCLFRGPEMVVETLDKEFPGHTFHAFLAAGVGRRGDAVDDDARRADEFLRNAEPPSHDQWIPGSSGGAPRVNLANNYRQPYVSVLRRIRDDVLAELKTIFLAPPPPSPDGPPAVTQHLQFLARDPSPHPPSPRKPVLTLLEGEIDPVTDAWTVTVQADMANRPEGWSFEPILLFVGDDTAGERVPASVDLVDGCHVDGSRVIVAPKGRARRLTATFTLRSDPTRHPIPAHQASVSVEISGLAADPAAVPQVEGEGA